MSIFKKFIKSATTTFIKNKPAIMTGIALVSLGTTVYVALKEGGNIKEVLDIHKDEVNEIENDPELTAEEKVAEIKKEHMAAAKAIAPSIGMVGLAAGITAFSIFGINKAHTAKEIAASALLESYKAQVLKYEEKLPDVLGKKKAEEFMTDVHIASSEELSKKSGTDQTYTSVKYTDKVPMIDSFGTRFIASHNELDKAINHLGKELVDDQRPVNYSDFMYENFSKVDINENAADFFFDPDDIPTIRTEVYQDPILDTPAYHVYYRYGGPVPSGKLEHRY